MLFVKTNRRQALIPFSVACKVKLARDNKVSVL